MSAAEVESKFEFTLLPRDVLAEIRAQSKDTIELFQKWCMIEQRACTTSMHVHARTDLTLCAQLQVLASCLHISRGLDRRMRFATFLYSKHFQTYQKEAFALVSILC